MKRMLQSITNNFVLSDNKAIAFGNLEIKEYLESLLYNNYNKQELELIRSILIKGKGNLAKIIKILNKNYKLQEILTNAILIFENNKVQHSLKFTYNQEVLYLEDIFMPFENRNKLKVKKIGDLNINYALTKIKLFFDCEINNTLICKLLSYPEILKSMKIIGDDYNITIENNGKDEIISFSKMSENLFEDIFYKEHEKHELINSVLPIKNIQTLNLTEKNKLNYSLDSVKKILKLLCELSPAGEDKKIFQDAFNTFSNLSNIESYSDEYLNWMILSSYFLFCEKDRKELSKGYYPQLEKIVAYYNCYFLNQSNETVGKIGIDFYEDEIDVETYISNLKKEKQNIYSKEIEKMQEYLNAGIKKLNSSNSLGCNEFVYDFKSDSINWNQFITNIRNALAHSAYEVVDEDYVRLYGFNNKTNEKNFNVLIHKNVILKIVEEIICYDSLKNTFILTTLNLKNLDRENIKHEEGLKNYLSKRVFVRINDFNLKDLTEEEYNDYKYNNQIFLENLNKGENILNVGVVEKCLEKISKYANLNCALVSFAEEEVSEIIMEIKQLGDYFYNLSFENQNKIIVDIYKRMINPSKGLANAFYDLIESQDKNQNSLTEQLSKESISIYSYSNYIRVLLLSFLNSILLYPWNENYTLNSFQLNLYKTIELDKEIIKRPKINKKTDLEKQRLNIETQIEKMNLKRSQPKSLQYILTKTEEELKLIEEEEVKKIEELKNKLQKNIEEYQVVIEEIQKIDNNEENINHEILEHLRNALAHGNIEIENIDINDIRNMILIFEDFDKNKKTFSGKIRLSDLMKTLLDEEYLNNLYIKNENFNKSY